MKPASGDLRRSVVGATRAELALVVGGLAALLVLQVLGSGSVALLTRTPWLDECLTLLVVNDSSFWHGLAAIRGGVENTPPAYFAVMWPIAQLRGGLEPVELRVLNCFFILSACAAVFGTCRLFVGRERAAAGALVVAIHPAVVVQLFQVRFYGFWLAVTAWLVYATVRHVLEPERGWLLYARCALAALVVGSHWFGVIALTLITMGHVMAQRTWRVRREVVLPMLAGVLTLGLCLPFLAAQRSGLAVPTWIEPLTLTDVAAQARSIFGPGPLMLLAAMGVGRILVPKSPHSGLPRSSAMAPGFTLLLFPLVLTVLSVVMQPVLRSRYMIPAVIPIGLLLAWLTPPASHTRSRLLAFGAFAAMVVIGTIEVRQLREVSAADVAAIDRAVATVDSLRAAGNRLPIVFLRRFEHYPVLQQRPEHGSASALVDFDGDGGGLSRLWVFERDMARRVTSVYPQYKLAARADLDRLPQFLVVARSQDEATLRKLFPGHEVSPRSLMAYTLVQRH